jgi:hypothetical protein
MAESSSVSVTAINAKGPDGTRCRAGIKFGPEATVVKVVATDKDVAKLMQDGTKAVSKKGLEALNADPVLMVVEVKEKAADKKSGGKK